MITIGNGQFHVGDCLDVMRGIPDASVDMILCDLPYGTTACSWDAVIPFEAMWAQYWRVVKPSAAIVLTSSQPFTTALIASQTGRFKYELIWEKTRATGHVHAKNKPMKKHENVLIFSRGTTVHATQSASRMLYNPQGITELAETKTRKKGGATDAVMGARPSHKDSEQTHTGYPTSVLKIASEGDTFHPTQKPVALFEYLIRTYTNEGDTVLDNCAGSGTTAIAAENAKRRWICVERDQDYATKAVARIRKHVGEVDIFG
jgi:site-specific DNA-methyltransferase (adenine-specific)